MSEIAKLNRIEQLEEALDDLRQAYNERVDEIARLKETISCQTSEITEQWAVIKRLRAERELVSK